MATSKEKAIATVENQKQAVTYTPEEVNTIRATVAKGASDTELAMFLHLSQKYDLDPFAKEIWFIKQGNSPVIMTSRDGYLKIANNNPAFDGLDSDVVYERDNFRRVKGEVEHSYGGGNRGRIVGAYAAVYKKNTRCPVFCWAPIENYAKQTSVWRQYPHAMILKVAEAMALKRAFSLSGLVTREELDEGGNYNVTPIVHQESQREQNTQVMDAQVVEPSASSQLSPFEQRKREIWSAYMTKCGGNKERAQQEVWAVVGQKGYMELTSEDLDQLAMMPNFDSAPDVQNPEPAEPVDAEVA